MTSEEYRAAIEAAKEYIRAGDIFQVVLSQRFDLRSAPTLSTSTAPCGWSTRVPTSTSCASPR